ncbi:MAG: peptide chain release factor N(5)-glutamine methyltransferase [Sphingomonadaceae bacterium]
MRNGPTFASANTPHPNPSPEGEGLVVRLTLLEATRHLSRVSATPRLDAELLMAHALGCSREAMLLTRLDEACPDAFAALIERRVSHEPLAYIIGTRDFWTFSLKVTPDVLIPRPDSETLIDAAVSHFGAIGPKRVLDLGTGSGALLLAALAQWPEASGIGVDMSSAALAVAADNALALGLADRATFQTGDWASGIGAKFDLILCNPPYVETGAALATDVLKEPHAALFAGVDGLDDYQCLIPQLLALIAPGGLIAVEIGHSQREAVMSLFAQAGMATTCRTDLGGRDRAILHFALGFGSQPA